jgi:hypothetical protein
MYIIISEAIFVGIYTIFISMILSKFNIDNLFIIGFIKHFTGGFFIHKKYCLYKNSYCKYKNPLLSQLIIESIGEGILFIIVKNLLNYFNFSSSNQLFFIGVFLHLIFELLNLHQLFCMNRCKNNKSEFLNFNILQIINDQKIT